MERIPYTFDRPGIAIQPWVFSKCFCLSTKGSITVDDKNSTFNVSPSSIDDIGSYFQTQFSFSGYYATGPNCVDFSSSDMQILYSNDLNATLTAITRSMSNAIRSGDSTQTQQNGTTGTLVVQYRIQWPWIALQCIWLLIGTVSLITTMLTSDIMGAPVWKSSALAAMLAGSHVQRVLEGATTLEELEQKAKLAPVQLFEPAYNIDSDFPTLSLKPFQPSSNENPAEDLVSLLSSECAHQEDDREQFDEQGLEIYGSNGRLNSNSSVPASDVG
jgi:hypothetical protein